MDRSKKEEIVSELNEKLKRAKIAMLADYSGIRVKDLSELRNELRKTGSDVKVVKNNLLSRALKDTEYAGLDSLLGGPRVLILNYEDVVAPTKVLVEFAKKNASLEIKGGVYEGSSLSQGELTTLASLPGKEVLQAKLLSMFVAVQTQLVTVLSGVPRGLVTVLDGYREKKEETN
ncbi:MAG: 50S ribosomal protein L10 [Syntrophales bacterium]|nr:50S ribosomal protein L10 [Syntrophales bacterium]